MAEESREDEFTRIVVLLLVVLAFVVIILMDLVKAGRRKAHWIPCDFLVLNALIIQLLNMLSDQSALLKNAKSKQKVDNIDTALSNQGLSDNLNTLYNKNPDDNDFDIELCMIHSSRVMLCVVVAYLLPNMASRGSENFWGTLLALIITIFVNMTSEVYTLHSLGRPNVYNSEILFVLSASIISISFMFLICLLGCANIASRGVEVVFVQKIPLLLSESVSTPTSTTPSGLAAHDDEKWKTSERQVLRAWIVARAYSSEYIIARSPLTCSVASIVTLQIVISVVGWILKKPELTFSDALDVLKLFVTVLQCFFILMGWAIIVWRWFTAVAKYQRWYTDTWRSTFRVEDFWTRHIRELMDSGKQKLAPRKRLQQNVKNLTSKQKVKIQLPSFFLQVLLQLQWQLVLFSKVCWFFSIMMFHNKYISKLLSAVFKKQEKMEFEDYEEYANVLEGLDILGETPRSLWIANQNAIAQARELIVRGHRDAEYKCEELINFLSRYGHPEEYCNALTDFLESHKEERNNFEELINFLKEKGTFKYLYRKIPDPVLEVQKHFVEATKWSWKMTAVSLISILIQLSPIFEEDHKNEAAAPSQGFKDGKASFPSRDLLVKVYSQAWEIINFIEETDLESDGIISKAADFHFSSLKKQIKKGTIYAHKCPHGPREQCVPAAIDELADEGRRQTEQGETRLPLFQAFAECARRKKEETSESESGKKGPAVGSTAGKTADKTGGSDIEKKGPAVDSMAGKTGQKNKSEKTESILDSMPWKTAAAGNAVYNLCKSIEHTPNEKDFVKDLVEEIICTLTSIIYICTQKVGKVAVAKSKNWARDLDENKIGEALYPVGKARVVARLLRKAESKGGERRSVEWMENSADTTPHSHSLDTPPHSHSLVIST